jgi:hypothetical protein
MVTDEPNESEDFIMVAKNAPKAAKARSEELGI